MAKAPEPLCQLGHDFEIVSVDQSIDPHVIICVQCGRQWSVKEQTDFKSLRWAT